MVEPHIIQSQGQSGRFLLSGSDVGTVSDPTLSGNVIVGSIMEINLVLEQVKGYRWGWYLRCFGCVFVFR